MTRQFRLERLDARDLPSVTVATPTEAFAYVLINEMRQDPAGFAGQLDGLRRGATGAFGFSRTDPIVADLNRLLTYSTYPGHYGLALQMLRSTPAVGALGYDDTLAQRAQAHTQWMETHAFEHTGQDGPNKTYIPGFNTGYRGGSPDQWGYSGQYYWWGEDIGYTWGLLTNSKAAFLAGQIGRVGFQERAAFIDTVSYILEVNSPDMAHLQQLLRPDGGADTGTPQFNAIGMDLQFYEAPGEVKDGLGEATISTHRLGLFAHGNAGGFLSGVVYRDVNHDGAFDAGEGIAATVQFSGPASFTETVDPRASQGIVSDYVPDGTYTVTATAADGASLGTQVVTIENGNGWFSFREVESAAATSAEIGSSPQMIGPTGTTGLRPVVTWAAVPGAAAYQVRVADVTTGQSNVFRGTITGDTTWSPPADLVSGHSYRVAVRALFPNRDGPWSAPDSFQVARPILSSPDGPIALATPTFTWTGVGGTTRYVLTVTDLTTGQAVLTASTAGTSWTPTVHLTDGHLYGWQVAARNGAGLGRWSDLSEFQMSE
jgi:hypothetical protein